MTNPDGKLRNFLSDTPQWFLNSYAVFFAFMTYFCMYAFRKPFSAAQYINYYFFSTQIELKTALVVGQILGYACSKALGIKFCSEAKRGQRPILLGGLILCAELALVLFAVLPQNLKIIAIFFNGLPLGMVWGLVVRYLEGRRASEILLAGLSCSFIVSSGVVKDVGRALLAGDSLRIFGISLPNPFSAVSEFWMPAATGLLFLLPFLLAVWFLDHLPEPSAEDILARTARQTMDGSQRWEFLLRFLPGMAMLIVSYVLLTAFRDYRDNYMVDILGELGYTYEKHKDLVTNMELGVAFGVMFAMALLFFIKDNHLGLLAVLAMIGSGMILIGLATLLCQAKAIGGVTWMALTGLGTYLAYVPYNSVLFDRLIASTRFAGTAVFAIYLADTMGYTGSIAVQLYKDLGSEATTRAGFLEGYGYIVSIIGALLTLGSGIYFVSKRAQSPNAQVT
ncbi:MAG: DUF5690 family protein [Bythopirellula sp.]|nr:DUF5690 family protein [Bythopirellula sp.]